MLEKGVVGHNFPVNVGIISHWLLSKNIRQYKALASPANLAIENSQVAYY